MPDEAPSQYRVTGTYADDVPPPRVAGEVTASTEYASRDEADIGIEELVGRTDIGQIILSTRNYRDGGWRAMHTWNRTPAGWRYAR
jgi:hypothetical protein